MNRDKVIFWDFDGVIIDSMPIRNQGFYYIFKDFDQSAVELLMQFHQRNGGLSRYVKIRYFYEEILGKPISVEQVNQLAKSFSELMLERLVDDQLLIDETNQFISKNHTNYKFHIVSGSDQNELRQICYQLKLDKFFKSIHGSPTPKVELVDSIIVNNAYDRNNCILIGDSVNDYEAAIKNGICFYGFNNPILKEYGNYLEHIDKLNF